MDTENILYRYVGEDAFPGIPAHDLTQADFDRLPILRQLDVKASASYELVTEASSLAELTVDDLQSQAKEKGLKVSGSKDELIERLEKGASQ